VTTSTKPDFFIEQQLWLLVAEVSAVLRRHGDGIDQATVDGTVVTV
jgi:hypothetical protein